MNNAEQISKMLEGLGFEPYHMRGYAVVKGYSPDPNSQRWGKEISTVIQATIIQVNAVRWVVIVEEYGHTREVYRGPATPSLIRSILEVNGLVEVNPKSFREDLADFMERRKAEIEVSLSTVKVEGVFDEKGVELPPSNAVEAIDITFWQGEDSLNAVEFLDMDKNGFSITPEMLRGKAEEK